MVDDTTTNPRVVVGGGMVARYRSRCSAVAVVVRLAYDGMVSGCLCDERCGVVATVAVSDTATVTWRLFARVSTRID